ncbi:MAG TPA: NAD(P)-dependent oxidoreductase [Candidatus Limnocylindria bacterium]
MTPEPKFLLIGAGGLVGRHLRNALHGRQLVTTYRRDAPRGALELDLTNPIAAERLVRDSRPDVILLAAADAWVERCEREPVATRVVNVDAPRAIAQAAAASGALLVAFSSEYVFDGGLGAYSESDRRAPINEYGRQKVELEDLALEAHGLVCRTSAVFGEDPNRKNFVCQIVDRLRDGRAIDVANDQLITPTYAPSLAEAVVALAEQRVSGIFHIAGPAIVNRLEFARAVAEGFGLDPTLVRGRPTSEMGLAAPRPLRGGLRTDKLYGTLGHGLTDPVSALREMARAPS